MKTIFAILLVSLFSQAQAYETKTVQFMSQGEKLVGTLFLPSEIEKGQKVPAVVVTGAWTTVKEQMPKTYAIELANRGYAALTFDFRGWGESGGKNRYLEDPERKTEDIVAAVNYLSTRPEVLPNKLTGLGVCASSGYMAEAFTRNDKLKTVALVAPWLHDKEIATKVYGGEESVKGLLDAALKAESRFKKTGSLTTAVAASSTDKNSIMFKVPYYTEKDRGLIKEYDNKFNVASWSGWLNYDALASASKLRGKVLFVGSDAMALPQGAAAYEKLAKGKVEKLWLDNVTQFDFYDKKEAVTASADAVVKHFKAQSK
ncbi:MAG: alpha/beta hydrolase [Bdellovibrionales bacterium]|nr:alpha/beta hydrolase [Bdellovibrionales bacterium]